MVSQAETSLKIDSLGKVRREEERGRERTLEKTKSSMIEVVQRISEARLQEAWSQQYMLKVYENENMNQTPTFLNI